MNDKSELCPRVARTSEEEIALGERKNGGGLACDEVSVDAYFVSFGIHGGVGRAGIVDEIFFPDIVAGVSRSLSLSGRPAARAAVERNVMLVAAGAQPKAPNIGR